MPNTNQPLTDSDALDLIYRVTKQGEELHPSVVKALCEWALDQSIKADFAPQSPVALRAVGAL